MLKVGTGLLRKVVAEIVGGDPITDERYVKQREDSNEIEGQAIRYWNCGVRLSATALKNPLTMRAP